MSGAVELDIRVEIPQQLRRLAAGNTRQIPFALSLALNRVTRSGQKAQTDGIFRRFKVRRAPRLRTSVRMAASSKENLVAKLVVRDAFLIQHEEGGVRRPGDVYSSIVQPIRAKERRRGVVYGSNTPKAVLAGTLKIKPFIARMRNGKVGVFTRRGKKRNPIDLIFTFERESKLRKRLKMGGTVGTVVALEWEREFGAALMRSIETAG
jgi:hypothetical protein